MDTNAKIQLRHLGKTDILVTPIGLGVMEMAGGGGLIGRMFPVISQEEKNAIIKAALDGGINWFDTAEMYGAGVSERSLAIGLKAAGKTDKDVIVATKWQPFLRTARNIPISIEDRLRFLDGFSIANYMVHQPYSFSSPEAEMNAMADLVEAGKIRSVGVSNFNAARMRRAHAALAKRGLPLAVNQMRYSLLSREIETNGVLETAKELGVTITAYTPLATRPVEREIPQEPGAAEPHVRFPQGRYAAQPGAHPPAHQCHGRYGCQVRSHRCPGGIELGDQLQRGDRCYHPGRHQGAPGRGRRRRHEVPANQR